MKVYLPLLPLAFLALVSSCGKSNSDAGIPLDSVGIRSIAATSGFFMANLTTLNPEINGTVPGTAVIIREGEKFQVFVKASPGGAGVWHQQNVHVGSRCPTKADDKNGDGIIDIEEGQKVWGNVLIPLDAELSSQDAGKGRYPIGDEAGNYFYERFTNYDAFYRDLISEDRNTNDHVSKLVGPLNLNNLVIVVLGANKDVTIPGTVAARSPHSAEQSFPIACGVFSQVTQIPGGIDSGNSGPVRSGDGNASEPTPTPVPTPTPEPEPEPEVGPTPEPRPNPTPTPTPEPEEEDDEDDDDNVLDRVSDWWRRRWEDIGGRRRPVRFGRTDMNH
ncbi:hypothetical protein ACJVC5_12530 [Peredibacter sp. HCB2-198]|uniref:hypothetical protein n=1 Tax=Peredibacter sp. HCB2-198 TaxID=3383025 RepID=UPI0038B467FE